MAYKIKTRYGGFKTGVEARNFAEKNKLKAEGYGYDKKNEHFFEVEGENKPKEAYEEKKSEKYNGWNNFQTWQVALNIDNDEGTYHASRYAIKRGEIKDGESYKDWFKENFKSEEEGFYKIDDGWSEQELEEVDWDEIYQNHTEE